MAVRWPASIKAGTQVAAPTSTLDLTATYMAVATGKVPADYDGRSLFGALTRGAALDAERPLFWRSGERWAVRKGDWKLVCSKDGRGPRATNVTLLVNLKDDPSETTDLSAKHPAKRKELEALFKAWSATLAKPLWGQGTAEQGTARKAGEGGR